MIPAFRNCRTSPEPGWTTTTTVSATSATSVSDCPTPTVSITTTSNAAASAPAAARVAGASPPSRFAGRGRADEHRAVGGIDLDPRPVSEQRPARASRGRIDGQHGDRAPARAPQGHEPREQRGLPHARRPGDADDVRRCLSAELRRGRASASSAAVCRGPAAVGSPPGSAPLARRSGRARAAAAASCVAVERLRVKRARRRRCRRARPRAR